MAFDIIVFSQKELENALGAGYRSVALCDNSFELPDIQGISYTIIGNVNIRAAAENSVAAPKPAAADMPQYGSFASSNGSFQTSYAYEYEYKYGSFSSSYASSFASSYSLLSGMTLYSGSGGLLLLTGTSYSSSYGSSYSSSYNGSFKEEVLPDIIEYGSSGIIFVNGYGINLI